VVFGMPQEAIKLGAATDIIPLPQMAQAILHAFLKQPQTADR
jgi:chemotaxis response regulator CheB